MKKIEIKLKECCLTCEHFDPSGCVGIVPSVLCCGEPDRMIACGHMEVCAKYNNGEKAEDDFGWIRQTIPDLGLAPGFVYECKRCHEISRIMSKFCPHCGQKNMRNET